MQHGSQRMQGPQRGTPAWWRAPSAQPGAPLSAEGPPATTPNEGNFRYDEDEGIRWDLVNRVRRELAAGAYDTPDRWEAALDRLLDQIETDE